MCNEMEVRHDVKHLRRIREPRRIGAKLWTATVLKLRPESMDDESEVFSAAALRLRRVAVAKLGRPGQAQDIVVKFPRLLCGRGNQPGQKEKTEKAE